MKKINCTLMYVYKYGTSEEHFDVCNYDNLSEAKREAKGYDAYKIVDEQGMCLYGKSQEKWNHAYARYLKQMRG